MYLEILVLYLRMIILISPRAAIKKDKKKTISKLPLCLVTVSRILFPITHTRIVRAPPTKYRPGSLMTVTPESLQTVIDRTAHLRRCRDSYVYAIQTIDKPIFHRTYFVALGAGSAIYFALGTFQILFSQL